MTVPLDFDNITDLEEAFSTTDLYVAAESSVTSEPTKKIALATVIQEAVDASSGQPQQDPSNQPSYDGSVTDWNSFINSPESNLSYLTFDLGEKSFAIVDINIVLPDGNLSSGNLKASRNGDISYSICDMGEIVEQHIRDHRVYIVVELPVGQSGGIICFESKSVNVSNFNFQNTDI